ncbi:DUF7668 domain-containing protein [Pseudoalteromonas rhizosphaerae]|uniref:DUF7668 domain-containing protein n=1 Tax=Pseudoalteromonas rhizosphaerae TaxID=2518973 RepID=A0ABW8L0V6_9GAMM
MIEDEVKAIKDEENELPIPTSWRPVFSEIVESFVKEDYLLSSGIIEVDPVSNETADQIKEYVQDYGEKLVSLSDGTWNSSVCIWMGSWWDVLIDLWTETEGRSDMVLSAKVFESDSGFKYSIQMVYVP